VAQLGRRLLGLPYWSLSAYLKGKVKQAVSSVTAFETGLTHEASRRDLHGVVCGHIRRAEMREIGGILYCNTGDWVESCTALVERLDGSLELLRLASPDAATTATRAASTVGDAMQARVGARS